MQINQQKFQKTVWDYYHQHGRKLPWRQQEPDGSFSPYKILVSEIMLQQTQVARVFPKYRAFIEQFPDVAVLARAPLSDVLKAWSGLGYNRRAKYLQDACKLLALRQQPWTREDLLGCKGVGVNTAAAVMVYAYSQPLPFVETNIRTVYINHFFTNEVLIPDKAILELVQETMDSNNPREWYWALMDYGTHLKSTVGNASRFAKNHAKQKPFVGSTRQIRGQVIRLLTMNSLSHGEMKEVVQDHRLESLLMTLEKEKLIQIINGRYVLST